MTRARILLCMAAALLFGALAYVDTIERPGAIVNAGIAGVAAWVLMQCVLQQRDLLRITTAYRADQYELMRQTTGRGVEVTSLQQELKRERALRRSEAERARAEVDRLKGVVMESQELVAAYRRHGYEGAANLAPTLSALRDQLSQFGQSLDFEDTAPNSGFRSMRGA